MTRIGEVDDVVVRGAEEAGRRGEFGEPNTRASKTLDKRVNEKECKTKLRILHNAVGADMASREEDEERTAANQPRKRDKSQRSVLTAVIMGTEKEG